MSNQRGRHKPQTHLLMLCKRPLSCLLLEDVQVQQDTPGPVATRPLNVNAGETQWCSQLSLEAPGSACAYPRSGFYTRHV